MAGTGSVGAESGGGEDRSCGSFQGRRERVAKAGVQCLCLGCWGRSGAGRNPISLCCGVQESPCPVRGSTEGGRAEGCACADVLTWPRCRNLCRRRRSTGGSDASLGLHGLCCQQQLGQAGPGQAGGSGDGRVGVWVPRACGAARAPLRAL